MTIFIAVMVAVAGIGCFITERRDRPRRRAAREAALLPAE
ncbi:hypothetical protein SAMN06297144_2781 [Sphingomonas guangdongensis]|uniref:Uncharacterized protein n=1 Tax=Sphingomonas guangdongensis TaxID=1141890 RepID=A0A285R0L4_9SPHN|nr:hypothetical protein SAMN06297144_2781 [Sphingomonas guangdongensis]